MSTKKLWERLPESPGVYLMRDGRGRILYIGKAANLRRRVQSYFVRPLEHRLARLIREVRRASVVRTETALEALILESALIKRHQPPYNVREKDDTSFLHVAVTGEPYPRILLVRGRERAPREVRRFGPFVSASAVREALRILRRIFPWHLHAPAEVGKHPRPCFDAQIGLCPGTCVGAVDRRAYLRAVRNVIKIFEGRKSAVLRALEREMARSAKVLAFERAAELRRQIFALRHIEDTALISDDSELKAKSSKLKTGYRIEGYDVSNISGTSAVGVMVVYAGGKSAPAEYRKFHIRTLTTPNDVGMLREVLARRLRHREWPFPDLILVDGGKAQVAVVRRSLAEAGQRIPVVGLAKGPTRKKNEFVGTIPAGVAQGTLVRVRDAAHRFAVSYHRRLRSRAALG